MISDNRSFILHDYDKAGQIEYLGFPHNESEMFFIIKKTTQGSTIQYRYFFKEGNDYDTQWGNRVGLTYGLMKNTNFKLVKR